MRLSIPNQLPGTVTQVNLRSLMASAGVHFLDGREVAASRPTGHRRGATAPVLRELRRCSGSSSSCQGYPVTVQ